MNKGPIRQNLVVGRHAVAESLARHPERASELLYSGASRAGNLQEVLEMARAAGVKLRRVERSRLDQMAQGAGHQGVALLLAEAGYADLAEVLERAAEAGEAALLVMADHIQDPHNLGALARSALAAGAQGLVIPKDRACPLSPAVAKAAAGALERLPVARVTNLSAAAQEIKEAGLWLLGAATRQGQPPWELDLNLPLCLVVGGEHKGLGQRLAGACDMLASLPLSPGVESLNASVAAGVLLFEIVRQRAGGRS